MRPLFWRVFFWWLFKNLSIGQIIFWDIFCPYIEKQDLCHPTSQSHNSFQWKDYVLFLKAFAIIAKVNKFQKQITIFSFPPQNKYCSKKLGQNYRKRWCQKRLYLSPYTYLNPTRCGLFGQLRRRGGLKVPTERYWSLDTPILVLIKEILLHMKAVIFS